METERMLVRVSLVRDIPTISEIEKLSYADGRDEQEIRSQFNSRASFLSLLVGKEEHVGGFLSYTREGDHFEIIELAVHPRVRRMGGATRMIGTMKAQILE